MRTLKEYRAAAETLAIRKALRKAATKTEAAEMLGVTRSYLYELMDRYGIPKDSGFGNWSRGAEDAKSLLETILSE